MNTLQRFTSAVLKRGQFYSRLTADRFRSVDDATRATFNQIGCYCFFVGHPRSGHTIVRSVLDAHPNVVLSDELNAVRYVRAGFDRDRLFASIVAYAEQGARKGSRRGEYTYAVADGHQGQASRIDVIGDKNGGRTSKALAQDPRLLEKLKQTVGIPIRVIHVVRNPYDNIATASRKSIFSMKHNIDEYFLRTRINEQVLQQVSEDESMTVYQEDFLSDPQRVIASLCTFLGVEAPDEYCDACAAIINPNPNQTRFRTKWPQHLLDDIADRMSQHSFLQRYTFDEPDSASVKTADEPGRFADAAS